MTLSAVEKFRAAARRDGWLGQPLAVAVSGGGDSMGLLWLCLASGLRPCAAIHLDHGLRPSSADERRFVEETCGRLGLPFFWKRIDAASRRLQGESVEVACRRERYAFLREAAQSAGASVVALAHTADDQAETVLMNICRGCGLWGLAGIPRRRGMWVRPVLDFRRDELRDLLKDAGWTWVEDESNSDRRYTRNRVRADLLPELERQVGAGAAVHLAALAQEAWEARSDENVLMTSLLAGASRLAPEPFQKVSLKRLRLLSDGLIARLLRHLSAQNGGAAPSRRRMDDLTGLVRRSGRWTFQWDRHHDLTARDGHLFWGPSSERVIQTVEVSERADWGGWDVSFVSGPMGPWDLNVPVGRICLSRKPGDWTADFLPAVLVNGAVFAQSTEYGWEVRSSGVEYKNLRVLHFTPHEAVGGRS
ncbi:MULTISPECIES: tRNA lysidine(34) synthetase TilS [Jonquetella]|uniref:tRNA(Ile)-lysidine synthase n=1 Tax=Jonquetella anthropi DSM 22815 TaxID=885272 RepID=H0UJQ8_9BACT|nr:MULTISPECIES: tRNA lysidine(34) synthetase TilS [Jonquetella]EEX48907.1 tRNA(Ile)-lysidine synthetase [Jonquetella anthropi E3_33 E1]EHM12917.1 tRNA(Ile)-lysidine synthetase [Jonquetella anthropi DSM 22815]ERL23988.1 tRNA(Ile)-lysidine synthetase [Jonquetella sp. BV3C21]